jgi:beta propeller repeat protein
VVILRRIVFIVLITFSVIFVACYNNTENGKNSRNVSKEVYYTTSGYASALSENYMVVLEKGLRIIDLNTRKIVKEIMIPYDYVGGFDISGTRVVWSTYNTKEEIGKDPYYDETTNTDIFLYDITTDNTLQITTNSSGQIRPDIWDDYIVWQDNRNDTIIDNNPEWDIYLYKLSTKEEILISDSKGIHTNPHLSDNIVVWEDGRNFKGETYLRWGNNVPENNTDIYMYSIESGEETAVATGLLQECNPSICGNYIAWEDRNGKKFEADIYIYSLDKKEKSNITNDKYNQRNPQMYDKYVIWEDERNGISSNDVIINGKAPNSDIFLYDIEFKKEYLMSGKEPQIMPEISKNYISFITSRQESPEINVIKYK